MASGSVLYAQSASATMRISVRVVEAMTVSNDAPSDIDVKGQELTSGGKMTLNGQGDGGTLVQLPEKIKVRNQDGEEFELTIQTEERKHSQGREIDYRFKNGNTGKIKKGQYHGDMKTSVVYL